MKKLLLVSLCATALTLTACDKTTNTATSTNSEASTTTPAPAATLSSANAADMKNDMAAIQTLANSKAQEALSIQQEIMTAAQKGDKSAITGLIDKLSTYVNGFNSELDGLTLKSSEADALRTKMKESNTLGLTLSEESMKNPPDTAKIQELQNKAMELQKTILADMQALQAQK